MESAARGTTGDPQAKARHTPEYPCPVCGGHERESRHTGRRCYGFTAGRFVFCTREEHAGPILREGGDTYRHRFGACPCGTTHDGSPPIPRAAGPAPADHWQPDAAYWYVRDGRLIAQKCRWGSGADKRLAWRRPSGHGWLAGRGAEPMPLYEADRLAKAPPGSVVVVCEGEKAVDAAAAVGLLAVSGPDGAGHWDADYTRALAGHHVVIVADNDEVGREHAACVASAIAGEAASVRTVCFTELGEHADLADYLAGGVGAAGFYCRVLTAETSGPQAAALERDLEAAQGEIERLRGYADTLRQERDDAAGLAADHLDILRAQRELLASTEIDPTLKAPVAAVMLAVAVEGKFRGVTEEPAPLLYADVRAWTGLHDGKTVKKVLGALEAAGLARFREERQTLHAVSSRGRPVEGFHYTIQLPPRGQGEASPVAARLRVFARPAESALRRKPRAQREAVPRGPHCPQHPEAPLQCGVCGRTVEKGKLSHFWRGHQSRLPDTGRPPSPARPGIGKLSTLSGDDGSGNRQGEAAPEIGKVSAFFRAPILPAEKGNPSTVDQNLCDGGPPVFRSAAAYREWAAEFHDDRSADGAP